MGIQLDLTFLELVLIVYSFILMHSYSYYRLFFKFIFFIHVLIPLLIDLQRSIWK